MSLKEHFLLFFQRFVAYLREQTAQGVDFVAFEIRTSELILVPIAKRIDHVSLFELKALGTEGFVCISRNPKGHFFTFQNMHLAITDNMKRSKCAREFQTEIVGIDNKKGHIHSILIFSCLACLSH